MNRVLLTGCQGQHLSELDDVTPLIGGEPQSELRGVGDRVEHAAPRDVGPDGPDAGYLNRDVEMRGICRHVAEGDRSRFPVVNGRADLDEPCGRLESESGDGLGDLNHAQLNERRRDADRVGTRHRRILDMFHDHVAELCCGIVGRQHQVAARPRIAARFSQHQLPQIVGLLLQVARLV